jgi:hypothetical protein
MKHFVLFFLVSFFIVFNVDVNAKVEQSLNEYKIEQLQKGIDDLKKEIEEIKKDVDDIKEKKIENKKDNESLDKRIGDINGNVDRFGIIVTSLSILVTVVILSLGYFAYRGARTDAKIEAKKEAEDTTKDWLENDGKEKLNEIIQILQKQSEEEFNELVKEKTNKLNTLFEDFKQEHKKQLHNHEKEFKQKMKEHYTVEEKEEINKEAKISQEKEIKTFDDYWNIILQHNSNKEYDEILNVIDEVEKLENLTDDQKGKLYFAKGFSYQNKKVDDKAEENYKIAIDFGANGALFNLGLLYHNQKEYEKAEKYYLKDIAVGNDGALNNLSYLYFSQFKNKEKALELVQKSYSREKMYSSIHTLAIVFLWNEEFSKSYEKFEEWMEFDGALGSLKDISEYLTLLIAKGQHHKAKVYFENEKYQLKDKLKPIWYALMTLIQDENEIRKMGTELQTSVDDILKTIEELKQKYKI